MDDGKWERLGILTGLLLAAILALRIAITPTVPKDPTAWTPFFTDKQTLWLWTVWLTGAIVVVGTWFYGSVRSFLVRAEGGTGRLAVILYGAWLIQATLAAARHALLAIPALNPTLDPGITGTLLASASMMLGMVWFTFLLQTVAMAVVGRRTRAVPMWYIAFTWLAGVSALLGTFSIVDLSWHFSRAAKFRWVVLWTYVAWVAVTSVVCAIRSTEPETRSSNSA